MKYADGDSFTGNWEENKRHGKGVHSYKNGNRYSGDFFRGQMTGQGSLTLANGGGKYQGDFVDGVYHGFGQLSLNDKISSSYKGQFELGKKHG